jgi:hypothetical protein
VIVTVFVVPRNLVASPVLESPRPQNIGKLKTVQKTIIDTERTTNSTGNNWQEGHGRKVICSQRSGQRFVSQLSNVGSGI